MPQLFDSYPEYFIDMAKQLAAIQVPGGFIGEIGINLPEKEYNECRFQCSSWLGDKLKFVQRNSPSRYKLDDAREHIYFNLRHDDCTIRFKIFCDRVTEFFGRRQIGYDKERY